MILVEKEKKSHSYATSRLSAFSDEKKAKLKSFTKEFTHKVLKRLKEKGKLKRPPLNGNGNGHSQDNGVNGTPSMATPIASTPALSTPTPARSCSLIDTPHQNQNGNGDREDKDLVDDIFGGSDDEMDLDGEDDGDGDGGSGSLAIKTPGEPQGTSPFGLSMDTPQKKVIIGEVEASPDER